MYNAPKPVCRYLLTSELSNGSKLCYRASRDGAVVRALAFHQCGRGSIPGPGVICGLSLLLVLVLAPRVSIFSGYFGFPPFIKNKISKFQSDLDVKCLHMSPWLGRLGDYSLHYDVKIWFTEFFFFWSFALFVIVRSERDISAAILVAKFTCIEGLEEATLISSKYVGTLLPIILSGDRLQFLMPGPDKNESRQSTVPKKMATGTFTHSS